MNNMFTLISILIAISALLLGVVLTVKRWRAASRQRTLRRPGQRYRNNNIPGIVPITLRASRSSQAAHPPTVTVLPTAVLSTPSTDTRQAAQKRDAAFQTTVYALPLATALVLSQCPRCHKQVNAQDLFCGFCGMRLHRTTRLHD